MKKEYKTYDCEYMQIAKDPRYLYIHISVTFGAESNYIGIMFLYDSDTKKLKYSHDDRHIYDIRYGLTKAAYRELGTMTVNDKVKVNDMLNTQLKDKSIWFDGNDYTVFLRNGDQTNHFSVYEEKLFEDSPFQWIMDVFKDILINNTLEQAHESEFQKRFKEIHSELFVNPE